jgi:hypothetical protein
MTFRILTASTTMLHINNALLSFQILNHHAECCYNECITEQAALNKSSLLLKIILQNAQTVQLFIFNTKAKSIYKS